MGVDYDAVGGYGYKFSFDDLEEGFVKKHGKEKYEKFREEVREVIESEEFNMPDGFLYSEFGDRCYTGDTRNSGFALVFEGNDFEKFGSVEPLKKWIYNTFGIEVDEKPKLILEIYTW